MNAHSFETLIQWLGGLLACGVLTVLLIGIWQGTKSRRQAGRSSGASAGWLRSRRFYWIASTIFFGACYLGWRPLPLALSTPLRIGLLLPGSLLYLAGMLLALWGRLALGRNYFVSTVLGTQLFADHQLVTRGPYALVRHPMYVGLILASLGSLPIYWTWTTLLFATLSPWILLRARREEIVLAAEFGETWKAYCQRVPPFVPRWRR